MKTFNLYEHWSAVYNEALKGRNRLGALTMHGTIEPRFVQEAINRYIEEYDEDLDNIERLMSQAAKELGLEAD